MTTNGSESVTYPPITHGVLALPNTATAVAVGVVSDLRQWDVVTGTGGGGGNWTAAPVTAVGANLVINSGTISTTPTITSVLNYTSILYQDGVPIMHVDLLQDAGAQQTYRGIYIGEGAGQTALSGQIVLEYVCRLPSRADEHDWR